MSFKYKIVGKQKHLNDSPLGHGQVASIQATSNLRCKLIGHKNHTLHRSTTH